MNINDALISLDFQGYKLTVPTPTTSTTLPRPIKALSNLVYVSDEGVVKVSRNYSCGIMRVPGPPGEKIFVQESYLFVMGTCIQIYHDTTPIATLPLPSPTISSVFLEGVHVYVVSGAFSGSYSGTVFLWCLDGDGGVLGDAGWEVLWRVTAKHIPYDLRVTKEGRVRAIYSQTDDFEIHAGSSTASVETKHDGYELRSGVCVYDGNLVCNGLLEFVNVVDEYVACVYGNDVVLFMADTLVHVGTLNAFGYIMKSHPKGKVYIIHDVGVIVEDCLVLVYYSNAGKDYGIQNVHEFKKRVFDVMKWEDGILVLEEDGNATII